MALAYPSNRFLLPTRECHRLPRQRTSINAKYPCFRYETIGHFATKHTRESADGEGPSPVCSVKFCIQYVTFSMTNTFDMRSGKNQARKQQNITLQIRTRSTPSRGGLAKSEGSPITHRINWVVHKQTNAFILNRGIGATLVWK